MNLAALLDLGVPEGYLRGELAKLGLGGYRLVCARETRRGVRGTRAEVLLDGRASTHGHRSLAEIRGIVSGSGLSECAKLRAIAAFSTLARAEAKVHGVRIDEVRLHEVGAVDAIVEVVGSAVCLDWLAADLILCGRVELGGGTARCAHGVLPVPAPATAEMLSERRVPATRGGLPFEAATPTGVAMLVTCVDRFVEPAAVNVERAGYGLGGRQEAEAGALRVFLGTLPERTERLYV